ncbi:hypothetical protein SCP_1300380 [Sparassis crispa]|uniref:Uncharacterized protein n=1 Tax=Sparassis crispa TaxID=139825 RepID=A0A401H1C9_9APHY|nr:hypothetical protein SCP_1300380 [Sparassis crispa]GBE88224.1 hypothetical protein SCP_1300380 [Sparassis crispa]
MNGVKGSQPKARWLASLVTGAGKDLCKETKRLSISRSPPLPIGYERRKQDVPQVKPSYVTGTEFRKFSPYATLRQTCAKAENTQTPVVVSVVEVFEMDDVDVGDGSSEIGESQPCLFPRGYIPSPLNPWKHVFPHCTPDGSRSPRKNSIVKSKYSPKGSKFDHEPPLIQILFRSRFPKSGCRRSNSRLCYDIL